MMQNDTPATLADVREAKIREAAALGLQLSGQELDDFVNVGLELFKTTFSYVLSVPVGKLATMGAVILADADPLRREVAALRQEVTALRGKLDDVYDRLGPIARHAAIAYNLRNGDGVHGFEYAVVPFPDGRDPTQAPLSLPPLVNLAAISSLSADQMRIYLRGYSSDPVPQDLSQLERSLRFHVGCGILM